MIINNLNQVEQTLAKASENRVRIEQSLAISRSMADLVRAPLKLEEAISKIAKASVQPNLHLNAVSQLMSAMQCDHKQFTRTLCAPNILTELTTQMTQMNAISESITAPYQGLQEILRSQASIFAKLSGHFDSLDAAIKLSISQFSQATLAWDIASIGLANRMNNIDLLGRRAILSARLFEVPSAYAKFVQLTTERLAADPAPNIAARLRSSLNLAGHQLLEITGGVCAFVAVPEDNEEPEAIRILNTPFTQQDELLSYEFIEDENDIAALTRVSPSAQTVEKARRILELVTQCNEAGKTSTFGVEIFKPTTRLMTVFNDLPWISATDRWRFADVVDCLYFIFYEGAGKDNLRFLSKHGGPLTDEDCSLIWCIKHLRNKWSRHDADHGKEKEIQKSWLELSAKFRWLGLTEHPTDTRHFQQLHQNLLKSAEEFLILILKKLELRP